MLILTAVRTSNLIQFLYCFIYKIPVKNYCGKKHITSTLISQDLISVPTCHQFTLPGFSSYHGYPLHVYLRNCKSLIPHFKQQFKRTVLTGSQFKGQTNTVSDKVGIRPVDTVYYTISITTFLMTNKKEGNYAK